MIMKANKKQLECTINESLIMKQEKMEEKLWNMLYDLEDYLEYDETQMGRKLGKFIDELQVCKIKIKRKKLMEF